tara:strand:+ start:219 stop:431 length:213 start_codon:yes stop_codon:yes gene_type:complete
MWFLKLIGIILWISGWGIIDIILQNYGFRKDLLGIIYIGGICLTIFIMIKIIDYYKNKKLINNLNTNSKY